MCPTKEWTRQKIVVYIKGFGIHSDDGAGASKKVKIRNND
jgi:hypothetical protein